MHFHMNVKEGIFRLFCNFLVRACLPALKILISSGLILLNVQNFNVWRICIPLSRCFPLHFDHRTRRNVNPSRGYPPCYWKCNFPVNQSVRRSVGLS